MSRIDSLEQESWQLQYRCVLFLHDDGCLDFEHVRSKSKFCLSDLLECFNEGTSDHQSQPSFPLTDTLSQLKSRNVKNMSLEAFFFSFFRRQVEKVLA